MEKMTYEFFMVTKYFDQDLRYGLFYLYGNTVHKRKYHFNNDYAYTDNIPKELIHSWVKNKYVILPLFNWE